MQNLRQALLQKKEVINVKTHNLHVKPAAEANLLVSSLKNSLKYNR